MQCNDDVILQSAPFAFYFAKDELNSILLLYIRADRYK